MIRKIKLKINTVQDKRIHPLSAYSSPPPPDVTMVSFVKNL